MALDPVVLDDLTWADFNKASVQRIPAASGGLWTLNAPVDPGITLLDLFAWLLEQRVYWMDQVSDPLTRALLALLGIPPLPARAATTVLYVEPCWNGETPRPLTLNVDASTASTQFRLVKGQNTPVFSAKPDDKSTAGTATTETITLYPLADVTKKGRFQPPGVTLQVVSQDSNIVLEDRTADLTQGRAPALFGPDGSDTKIVLSLSESAAAPAPAGTLALLFDLYTPPGIDPAWSPDAATNTPAGPSSLTWLCTVNGTLTPLDPKKIVDSTLGLRRSGIVRLPIPDNWTVEPKTKAHYAVVLRGSNAGWTTPPRVSRIIPNVVPAIHSRPPTQLTAPYIQSQVTAWRRLPGNVFILPEYDRPALADSLVVTIAELGDPPPTPGDTTPPPAWKRVADLTIYGPDDLVYVYDDVSARIRFGNGVTGRLPVPKDTSSVIVDYQVGGGTAGNLGAVLAWNVVEQPAPSPPASGPPALARPELKAWNVVPAAGGRDAETLDSVRQRASQVLTTATRAITAADFEELATQTPGTTVARAHAAVGRHPLFPNQVVPGAITVFLVPDVPRKSDNSPDYGTDAPFPPGPVPDNPTLEAVQARLDQTRMVASEVFVEPVNYRPVTIDPIVTANPPDVQALRDALTQALRTYFDPLAGGDDGNGWPFGGPVRPSSLLKVTQKVVADAGSVDSVKITLVGDSQYKDESCADVKIGTADLIVLTQVNVTVNRPAAGRGGLR